MMKSVVVVLAAVIAQVCSEPAPQQVPKMYTTKYDFVDVELIIKNQRLFAKYVQCFLTDQKCTPYANELKRLLPDALNTECSKCSTVQKEKADKVFRYIYNNQKEVFDKLAARFDPTGEHRQRYSRYAEEQAIQRRTELPPTTTTASTTFITRSSTLNSVVKRNLNPRTTLSPIVNSSLFLSTLEAINMKLSWLVSLR